MRKNKLFFKKGLTSRPERLSNGVFCELSCKWGSKGRAAFLSARQFATKQFIFQKDLTNRSERFIIAA
ncbi:MAG: hypothetical protein GY757_08860 [bacterium]|nr:hypothetical protein [bacterium]